MIRRALLLLASLFASAAFAQQNSWSIYRTAGTAVMDEVSPLTFRVANAATSSVSIQSFTIAIPNGPYDIDGATAPAGWRASNIDKRNRVITFRAINACSTASIGLVPGQSALFEVRVLGVPLTADTTNDLIKGQASVLDICNSTATFKVVTGTHSWLLVGLSSRVTTNLRAMDTGDQVTVSLTITNASTVIQSGIAPTAPVLTGTATFALVSGPTPAAVNNLATGATATFSWVYRATGRGTVRFASSARNAAVSSALATSADINVGLFPAAVLTTPNVTVNNGVITLQVLPTNNGPSPLTHVTPMPATVTPSIATASATLLAGPTPATVDALGTRSTTAFTTTWTIRGDPGDKVTFQARAQATDALGVVITSDPISSSEVTLRELTLSPSPSAVISASAATRIDYTLANGSTLPINAVVMITPDANLFRTPTAVTPPSGWTASLSTAPLGIRFVATAAAQLAPGQSQTFSVNYASIGTVTVNTPTSHKAHVSFTDTTTARAEGTVTVAVNRPVPDIAMPVAVATPGRVHFTWSNPTLHDGVLILRSAGSPPNTAPTPGRRYPPGTMLGNANVVYEDALSFNSSFADTGLTNGTSYYYRLYNRDEFGLYSPGNVPTSSPNNYLLVITPGTTGSDALWCSTMGLPALQQPFTDLGKAVYQSTNGSYFTANTITTGAPVNGNEKWRPSLTRGVVQARPTAQKLSGATEPSIFVGDQLGYAYRVSGATGAIEWVGNGGVALGEVVQAQSVLALRTFAPAAFQALYPTDLVFFATRNSTNRSSNSVRALRADTGAQVFSYQPGDLDQVTGTPLLDGARNALWVTSLRTAGPSLRVLDLLNPTAAPLLTVSDLGDIPTGVIYQGYTNQALVVDRTGLARGYSIPTRTQAWQLSLGGPITTPLVPFLTDFFASTSTGVQRFHIDTATNIVTPVWATPTAMTLPTSVRVDGTAGKVFVGGADGYLRRLDFSTGAIESAVKVSTVGGTSMPSLDSTAGLRRVYIGTADGRLCAYPPTF